MYSTKNIEKILLANTTNKKSVLARKIQFINTNNNNKNIIVFVNMYAVPDTIFLYYHNAKSDSITDYFLIDTIVDYIRKNYESAKNIRRKYIEERNFIFNIETSTKTITTLISNENAYFYKKIPDIYTNEDTKKILKDLLKNNIITNDYKLIIGNNEYLVKDILSNKNTPIKYSKRGNPLLYHGTSKDNWEKIKSYGGIMPRIRNKNSKDNESFLESLVYLTTSFEIAKSYARLRGNNPVILLVEIPDVDKLYIDTGLIEEKANQIINKLGQQDFITDNKEIQQFREHLTWEGNYFPYFNDFGENKIYFNNNFIEIVILMKAVIDEDFSILERYIEKYSWQKFGLRGKQVNIILERTKELYDILIKYFKNELNSPKSIRMSVNNKNISKNAVAYHGRIPLSYIRGVFDINGQRIE